MSVRTTARVYALNNPFVRCCYVTLTAPIRRSRLRRKLRTQNPVHLHFGCGEIDDPRFINIDARPFHHVDVVTKDPWMRQFKENFADSIYACHVFEHIPFSRHLSLLRRWRTLLKPDGYLRLSVPDFDKIVNTYCRNRSIDEIQPYLMGGQDYPDNFHYGIFNIEYLTQQLRAEGFADIGPWHPRDLMPPWPRDWSWDDGISLNLLAFKRDG